MTGDRIINGNEDTTTLAASDLSEDGEVRRELLVIENGRSAPSFGDGIEVEIGREDK